MPSDVPDTLRATLTRHGQEHLLAGLDAIAASERERFLEELAALDLDALAALIAEHRNAAADAAPAALEPAPCYALEGSWDRAAFRAAGEALLRAGRVAAFTVAGGQGTRLGWRGPKGTYPATVNTGKPLFRVFAEQIRAASERFGRAIPWYIMTSPLNDAETRAFFADNNCFGLARRDVFMFPQGTIPSFDPATGRMLLESPGRLAVNPDGHGGSLRALRESGAVEEMRGRGIEVVSYFQVDNPSVKAIDPLFLGLHASAPDSSAEMSSKMVRKTDPAEKVGVFCRHDGRTIVVEYSDLPDVFAAERDSATGRLRFDAGSIAIHALGLPFIERLTEAGHGLPWHRAVKKVPCWDPDSGARVEPDAPNAVKLETFVFDALRFAESSIVLETDRVEEFAPIKNATGNDSPATSHLLQSERAARWLESRGVAVPRTADGAVDARLEISPLTALEPDGLDPAELPDSIAHGARLVL